MSFIAAPYVVAGTVSLLLGYKTYNSYYNQPFEYLEIDGSNDEQTEKTQENDTTKPKIVIEEVEEEAKKEEPEEPKEAKAKAEEEKEEEAKAEESKAEEPSVEEKEEIIEKVSAELVENVMTEVLNNETVKDTQEEKMVTEPVFKTKKLEIMETIKEEEEYTFSKSPIETKSRNTNNNLRKRRKKKNNRRRK